MAIEPTNLISSTSLPSQLRIYADPDGLDVATFINVAGAPLLEKGTPVAYDTNLGGWVAFEHGGSDDRDVMRGVVWPDTIQLHATNEVQGQIMHHGMVHVDDLQPPTGGSTLAQIKGVIVNPAKRAPGLKVQGLAEMRY